MCTVSFKIDDDDKKKAQMLFESMGLSFSGAMNIFVKACINAQGIPFEIKAPPLESIIKERLKEAEDPATLSPAFDDAKSMVEYLNAEI